MRTTVELVKKKAKALEQLEGIVGEIAALQIERDDLIAAMYRTRIASAREIGDIAGLSPNRVRQIAKARAA